MNILRPVDIEEEIRKALNGYFATYVRPLPAKYTLPNLLIAATGGSTSNTVDTFTVTLQARATEDADALEILRTALGVLEYQAGAQVGALRNVVINSLASWGNDPARPDLKLCSATVLVTAHRESFNISDS